MPTYVGLAEQGFYEPFKLLGQALAARRDRKQREREFALQQQQAADQLETSKLQRTHLQGQIDDLKPRAPVIPEGMEPEGLSVDPRGRTQTSYRLKAKPLITPPGMRQRQMSVDERGNQSAVFEPVPDPSTIPSNMEPAQVTVGEDGRPVTVYKPRIQNPGTQIVERPLPNGGSGLFLQNTNPETGQPTLTPYTKRSEQETRVGNELMQKLNITALALSQLPKIRQAVESAGEAGGPLASKATFLPHKLFGPSEDRLKFDLLRSQSLAPVAKGILGESGALSEGDMARYAPQFPAFEDTPAVRKYKLGQLETLISDQRNNILNNLKAAGYDVDKLEQTPGLAAPNGVTGGGAPITVNSQAEYDALPSGAVYIDSTGQAKTKK
jgi:hypothetical protein